MEQDTRIGLAMGILLIGIVGALFFRNERLVESDVPTMSDPGSLDDRIAERPIAPYLGGQKKTIAPSKEAIQAHNEGKAWEVPQFLKQDRNFEEPIAKSATPDPIPNATPQPREPVIDVIAPEQPIVKRLPTQPAPRSGEHKVQSGDTLSGIAEKYLGSSARYMEIYEMNRDRLRTPHDLRVGKAIRVPRVLR